MKKEKEDRVVGKYAAAFSVFCVAYRASYKNIIKLVDLTSPCDTLMTRCKSSYTLIDVG